MKFVLPLIFALFAAPALADDVQHAQAIIRHLELEVNSLQKMLRHYEYFNKGGALVFTMEQTKLRLDHAQIDLDTAKREYRTLLRRNTKPVPQVVPQTTWLTEPSYFTHQDGVRVQQHTPVGPFYYEQPFVPPPVYNYSRSVLQVGPSIDIYQSGWIPSYYCYPRYYYYQY